MKVLIVTEHYWPETFIITDLAGGLRDRGHVVEVLTGMPSYPLGRYFAGYRPWGPYSEVHEGIPIRRVPIVTRGRGQAWRLALNYGSFVAAATARLPRRGGWDAILVYQPSPVTTCLPALALRRASGAPVAMWVQDLWPEAVAASGLARSRWFLGAVGRLSRRLYASCDLLLAQSRAFLERLERDGVPRERLEYLPNWAEPVFGGRPEADGAATEPWQDGFPVMLAGNLGRVQALDTVLEAARLTRADPEVRWVMVGDGALQGWLAEEVAHAGLRDRVFLLGRRPLAEMPRHFARAGAMLVSLKADDAIALTIPSKVQAYLAAGRPILGSLDGEGARVIRESGAGLASAAGDAAGLAENVRRMKALSDGEREAMGRRGREYYDREFDRAVCLGRLEASLGRLAGRSAR